MRYPGGKNGAGVYQAIINQIPPHAVYVEAYVGSGAVLRNKAPAPCSIVIDADPAVAAGWALFADEHPGVIPLHGNARSILGVFAARGLLSSRVFIYCDPPYMRSTRRSRSDIYRHEMTDDDHVELLSLLRDLPALVMLSGYRSPYYDSMLWDWRRVDFQTMTRGGPAIESLWMNYPEPAQLADYSHLGRTWRQRQDFRRMRARWRTRLERMDLLKRQALIEAVSDLSAADLPSGAGATSTRGASAAARWPLDCPESQGLVATARSLAIGLSTWCEAGESPCNPGGPGAGALGHSSLRGPAEVSNVRRSG